MKKNSVLIAQIVGIVVLALAIFGIEVSEEMRADIIAGASAIGLIVTTLADRFQKTEKPKA